MSNVVVWGTSIAPVSSALRRRITSAGDLRITDSGDLRKAFVPPSQVIFLRKTAAAEQRVTDGGDRRITIDGLMGPQYFQTDNVPSDGGEPFSFSHTTQPWQPDAQGGEALFRWAFIDVSWSMSGTIRISPIVDGSSDDLTAPNGDVLSMVRSTFVLPQAGGSLQRTVAMFPVPLVQRVLRAGVEINRAYLSGQRLQLIVESTGPLGVGELMLEGLQVDTQPIRKRTYQSVQSP